MRVKWFFAESCAKKNAIRHHSDPDKKMQPFLEVSSAKKLNGSGHKRRTIMSLNVSISSPSDREFLVADIMLDVMQIAEVNVESGIPEIEIYPHPGNIPWKINFDEFLSSLNEAKDRLNELHQD
jgi:hypothetical protein